MNQEDRHIWIVVIQSLSEKDLIKSGKGLSIDMEAMCKLSNNSISSLFYEVSSVDGLKTTLDEITDTIRNSDHLIIHIDSHGDECGIGLGQEFIFWNDFTEMLSPLYNKTQQNLVLILSTCRGFFFSIMKSNNHIPCSLLIACKGVINGGVAGRAFRPFYNKYIKTKSISKAYDALTAYYKYYEKENPFVLLSFETNML